LRAHAAAHNNKLTSRARLGRLPQHLGRAQRAAARRRRRQDARKGGAYDGVGVREPLAEHRCLVGLDGALVQLGVPARPPGHPQLQVVLVALLLPVQRRRRLEARRGKARQRRRHGPREGRIGGEQRQLRQAVGAELGKRRLFGLHGAAPFCGQRGEPRACGVGGGGGGRGAAATPAGDEERRGRGGRAVAGSTTP
jgi:hypothetical protein